MILEELKIPLVFDVSGLLGGAVGMVKDAIGSAVGFFSDSVGEAMASQDALAQLDAVLKSTGGAAGVTRDKALELASAYQKVTKFSDEQVLSGENLLLTFTSIGKEVFPRATETILDMSTALGQDLKSSAIQLGKALNDPITGVTALRRVGVQFTEEQTKMIKGLVESGDLLGAQTMILDELSKEFGGSATAAGKTFGGQLEILKNKLSDIKETIGGALMPVLAAMADRVSKLIDSPKFQKMVDEMVGHLEKLGNWIIDNLPTWEEKVRGWIDGVGKWWNESGRPAWENIQEWLMVKIPAALDTMGGRWESFRSWAAEKFAPLLAELDRLFGNLATIFGLVQGETDGVAGKFTLLGIVQRIAAGFAMTMNIALAMAYDLLRLINSVLETAQRRTDAFRNAVGLLAGALARLAIPWWLTPGSPTPLEKGLRGIGSALDGLNSKSLPSFGAGLGGLQSAPAAPEFDYQKLTRLLRTELAQQFG